MLIDLKFQSHLTVILGGLQCSQGNATEQFKYVGGTIHNENIQNTAPQRITTVAIYSPVRHQPELNQKSSACQRSFVFRHYGRINIAIF
jgi:hypothetical protein